MMSKLIPWTKLSDDTSKVWYDTVSQDWCQRFHEALPSTLSPIPESKLVISAGEAVRATVSLIHGLGASFCLHTSFAHTLYWHKHGIITHTSRLQRQNILLQSMTTTMARASFRPQVHQNSKLLKLSPAQPRSMPAAHKTRIVSPLVVLILTELLAVYVCSKLWRLDCSLITHTHTHTEGSGAWQTTNDGCIIVVAVPPVLAHPSTMSPVSASPLGSIATTSERLVTGNL